jgi:hypothetical protein
MVILDEGSPMAVSDRGDGYAPDATPKFEAGSYGPDDSREAAEA